MKILHMEPDQVRSAAQKIDWAVDELLDESGKLKNAATSLRHAWSGSKSANFVEKIEDKAETLERELNKLNMLAHSMRAEANEWEQADREEFLEHHIPIMPYLTAGTGGGTPSDSDGVDYNPVAEIARAGDAVVTVVSGIALIGDIRAITASLGEFDPKLSDKFGPLFAIIDGGLMAIEWISEDLQRYSNEAERRAAVFVDLFFAVAIAALNYAGDVGIKFLVTHFLPFLIAAGPVGIVGGLLGGVALWLCKTAIIEGLKSLVSNPSVKDAMVKFLAGTG